MIVFLFRYSYKSSFNKNDIPKSERMKISLAFIYFIFSLILTKVFKASIGVSSFKLILSIS